MKHKRIKGFFIRSKANTGDLAKQYVFHLKSGKKEAIVIKKRVLIKSKDYYKWRGFAIMKKYKNHLLIQQMFEIKPDTLLSIVKGLFN
ncbi:hypothetical protein LCGC14_1345590 [marine sediment metagenome]|uniref:Uncharacterized protein n=1 Tax=marine sediment metagenome TaxID=412755 RepID=A0A0F9KCF9_9ZZZZ